MALTINDLKLLESENMTNFNDGGGAMSNNVIIDGASNNIMPDVTEQSRTYGNVEERKTFIALRSLNNDALFAAMSYISKMPKDEKINVNLTKSQAWFDERSNRVFKDKTALVTTPVAETTAFDVFNVPLRMTNTGYLYGWQNTFNANGYPIPSITGRFNCFLNGTQTTGATKIKCFGFDGRIGYDSAAPMGQSGLTLFFNLHRFYLEDRINPTHNELIKVKSVAFIDYDDAVSPGDYLLGETSNIAAQQIPIGTYNYAPIKKYFMELTLETPLQHTYQGASSTDKTTWLPSMDTTHFLTLSSYVVTPAHNAVETITDKKFYTAKKTNGIVLAGADAIAVTSNINKVIPTLDGLILDSETLGINVSLFNESGTYPAFVQGDVIVILNDMDTVGTFSNAQVVTLSRSNLSRITVRDAANNLVDSGRFTADLNWGKVTFINVSGLSQPMTITDRIEDLCLIKSITNTTIFLNSPLTHSYPMGSIVANCMLHNTLQAGASRPFDQQTWSNVWQSTPNGSTISAQYNFTDYPIAVTNYSAVEERWAIVFNTSTTFNLISEHLGTIITNGSTSTDLAPTNPNTAHPYFVLAAAGFGGGWSAGNVIRFDTYASAAPFWVLRTIAQGEATDTDFDFAIECRGEIDAA
jgi:hypothetical protein